MTRLWTPTGRWFLVAAVLTGVLLGLAACGGGGGSGSDDQVSTLPADDPAITQEQGESQDRWPDFVASLQDDPKLTHSVKVALRVKGGGTELIWVRVASIEGDTVKGTLDNDPVSDLGVKYGDPVSVERDQVRDWAVWKDGKVVLGGYSLAAADHAATTTTG